jgi:PAS domain S-box-containing protein
MAGSLDALGRAEPEIARLFGDPAFRELGERGGPAFVASVADGALAWANEAAHRLFTSKLESLPARLATGMFAGAAPRLKRLLIGSGEGVTPLTFLTKQASLPDGRAVLVAALLGARPAEVAAQPAAEPALPETPHADEAPQTVASDSAHKNAVPSADVITAQGLRAELLKSHRNPTIRFLWQTDAEGLVTSVTPPLAEIVGTRHADLVGRGLADIVEELRLDPSGKLVAAMRVPETWSGIEVAWPIAGAAASVPVDLGGFPVLDTARAFHGFRGFGVIHLDRIRDAEPLPEAKGASAQDGAPALTDRLPPAQEEQPPAATAPEVPPEPATAPASAPNVVPLRPYPALATGFGIRSPAPDAPALSVLAAGEDPAAEAPDPRLSESEHRAFDEIARALSEDAPNREPLLEGAGSAEPRSGTHAGAILDRLPLGVLVSRDEVPVYANRMMLDLTGYAGIEHLQAAGGLARLFEGPAPIDLANDASTTSIRTRQGDLISVESKLQAIPWEGRPASLITVRRASDGAHFAEARTLQLELKHRETDVRELRGILDAATDGVAVLDPNGRILSLNRSAEALFGYAQNEVAGEPFTMLIATESRWFMEDYLEKLKSSDVPGICNEGRHLAGLARHGGTIPIFLTLARIAADPQQPKFCAVIRDISASTRAEHEAREARDEAERASAIKSDFLAKVSHEIRTPLNAIIGFAEVIMDERLGPIGTERYKDYLRDIHKSGTHVMSLVNDLLDLSKIEAGKMALDIKSVDANAVITECVALMQPQANRERVIMRLALAPRLAQIAADERSLKQIVLNLLSNAVKYNEPGGQVIVSTAMNDTGHAVIRIKDTGIGMSETELAIALEPFRQVATARPVSGTGLGLPLTKALIEANRANLTIRSRKNEGTLVEVSFPPARVLAESA